MNKKFVICLSCILLLMITSLFSINLFHKEPEVKTKKITASVLKVNDKHLTVRDKNHIIYTFSVDEVETTANVGDEVVIEYTGLLDKNKNKQETSVINYENASTSKDENGIPTDWLDNGIFSDYYILANKKLEKMTLDEKIAQLLLVRYPDTDTKAINDLKKYQFGGFVFFERDFKNKTSPEVKSWIKGLQEASKIPLLTAVDEEGGKVVRVSSNPNLVAEKFKSSQELYKEGGLSLIKTDTETKSKVLNNLGLNLKIGRAHV